MDNQLHKLNSSRYLSYCIYGNTDGEPVFYFHGFPGSYHEIKMNDGDKIAKVLNIRLIAVNRPGYGDSDSQPKRSLLDWPDDIAELADSLGINKFSVIGCSGGGPYVIACAYKISDCIKKAGVVSGMGPVNAPGVKEVASWSIVKWTGFIQNVIFKAMKKMVESHPDKFLFNMNKALPEVDREFLKNPETFNNFIMSLKEAFRSGYKGAKQDAKIYKSNWGFQLKDVHHQLYLWQGEQDLNVKTKTAKYVASQLPDCVPKFYPDEGHLSLIGNNFQEILETLIKK